MAQDFPKGGVIAEHAHDREQLIYVDQGLARVKVGDQTWLVPPARALLVPSRVPHEISFSARSKFRTFYFLRKNRFEQVFVTHVSLLLRELILSACREPESEELSSALDTLIRSQLRAVAQIPVELRLPQNPQLKRFCRLYAGRLSAQSSKKSVSASIGLSEKNLDRLFRQELGTNFQTRSAKIRFLHAAEALASGLPVGQVARTVGFASTSAFIHAFKRFSGQTPKKYFSAEP